MNSVDMRMDIKPVSTKPTTSTSTKTESSTSKSDFKKTLEDTAQSSEQASVQQPEAGTQENPSVPQESGAETPASEDIGNMNDAAAMLAAMMLPIVVVTDEQQPVAATGMVEQIGDVTAQTTAVANGLTEQVTETVGQQMQPTQTKQVDVNATAQTTQTAEVAQPVQTASAQQTSGQQDAQQNLSDQSSHTEQTTVINSQQPTATKEEVPQAVVTEASAQVQTARPLFEQVESVPVQVGQPVQADSPEMPMQLGERIEQAVQQGQNTIEVQLTPQELGKITIRLSVGEEGTLVSLHSANAKTVSLLSEHAANIGAIVEQNHPGTVSVRVEQEQANAQQQYTQQEHSNQNGGQQQQQQRHQAPPHNDDFVQQFRLGLIARDTAE